MDDILDTTPDITAEYVEGFVSDIGYPITLDNIIRTATLQRAPQQVIDVLNSLEPGVYNDFNELDYYLRRSVK